MCDYMCCGGNESKRRVSPEQLINGSGNVRTIANMLPRQKITIFFSRHRVAKAIHYQLIAHAPMSLF